MIDFSKISDDLSNVKSVLKPLSKNLKIANKDMSLDNKNIAVANVEQPSLMAYYEQIKVELKFLLDYSDTLLRKLRGQIYKEILNNYSKSLTDRAMDKLIESDENYVNLYIKHLEIREVYEKYIAVVNGFTQRSYSLTNLVKIYEHDLQGITVHE